MTFKLGVVMDPIGSIAFHKDSTLAMLLETQARGWEIYYMEQSDLFLRDGEAHARTRRLKVALDPKTGSSSGPKRQRRSPRWTRS